MLKDLLDVKKVLDKYHTEFFLLYGTALGAYRDGDFLPGDDDIDLGTFNSSHREEIKQELTKLGFDISTCFDTKRNVYVPSKMILAIRNTQVDIFFFEEQKKGYVAHRDGFSRPFTYLPKKFNKTQKIIFKGHEFNIISPIEEYLSEFYSDWKSTKKEHGKLYKKPFWRQPAFRKRIRQIFRIH